MAKKITIVREGRTFECTVCNDGFAGAAVYVFEVVRPKWKIFRTRLFDTAFFFVEDYPTIEEGVEAKLTKLLEQEAVYKAIAKKWQDFENEG